MVRLAGATGKRSASCASRAEAFPVVLEFENPAAIGEMIDERAQRRFARQRAATAQRAWVSW